MNMYLRAKCQVSRITLKSFRQGRVGRILPLTSKQTLKKPTQIRVNKIEQNALFKVEEILQY